MRAFYYHSISGAESQLAELVSILSSRPWVVEMDDIPELDGNEIRFCGHPDSEDDVREVLEKFSADRPGKIYYLVADGDGDYANALAFSGGRESGLKTCGFFFLTLQSASVIADALSGAPGAFRSLVRHFIGLCRVAECYDEARELGSFISILSQSGPDWHEELESGDAAELFSVLMDLEGSEAGRELADMWGEGFADHLVSSLEARLLASEGGRAPVARQDKRRL